MPKYIYYLLKNLQNMTFNSFDKFVVQKESFKPQGFTYGGNSPLSPLSGKKYLRKY